MWLYVDCLRGVFKDKIAKENASCTLPWIQSMLGTSYYDSVTHPTCKTSEEYHRINDITAFFASDATTFAHQQCPGNVKLS